jgi:hypothetical protein
MSAQTKTVTSASAPKIVEEFYDAAVSGADPVSERPGFAQMLERLMSNGAKTIIVESPDRCQPSKAADSVDADKRTISSWAIGLGLPRIYAPAHAGAQMRSSCAILPGEPRRAAVAVTRPLPLLTSARTRGFERGDLRAHFGCIGVILPEALLKNG